MHMVPFENTSPMSSRLHDYGSPARNDGNRRPGHPGHPGLSGAAQRRISEFIERNISERFTLSDLADAACMSRFHFARMFRRTFGISPMEYVLRARIERAKPMLLARGPSVADVAATFGFCDQSHFTRSFRRITGCSPRQFVTGRIRAA